MSRRSRKRDRAKQTHVPATEPAPWLPAVAVIAVALASCLAGFPNEFTQDDLSIIRDSTRLHGVENLRAIFTLPYWPPPAAPDLYRPLASLLLAMQFAIGDGAPVVFRLVSFSLYAAACVGVLRLGWRLLPPLIATGMALLFAAHPVHVEAVALAVAQSEILVALLITVAVARYLDRRRDAGRARMPGLTDWVVLASCYLAAAFSKEQGLLLPVFLILAEICLVDGPSIRDRVRALWKGYAILGLIGGAALLARTAVLDGQVGPTMIAEALRGQTIGGRVLTMLQVSGEWFRLLIWPAHLRAEYSPREFVASTGFGVPEAVGLTLIVAAAAAAWAARRATPVLTFGILWSAVALLPVSNVLIPTGILIAERTLFLASIGFLLAAAGAAVWLARRAPDAWRESRHPGRAVVAAAVGVLVIAGVVRSALRERVWRNPETLTLASLEDSPRSWRVRQSHAEMMFDARRPAEAVAAFQAAIALAPEPWRARNRYAQRLRQIGADVEALEQLRRSRAQNPSEIETIAQIPPTLIALGQYAEARRLADSIIVVANAPRVMVWLRQLADSALAAKAPPGSIRVGIGER